LTVAVVRRFFVLRFCGIMGPGRDGGAHEPMDHHIMIYQNHLQVALTRSITLIMTLSPLLSQRPMTSMIALS
jgi:hypothetical protein